MDKELYRVTRDPEWLKGALESADHLIVKAQDGTFLCRKHNQDPIECAGGISTDVVWQNSLDQGKYTVSVVRVKPYCGRLKVSREEKPVLDVEVSLSYNAQFGPDVEDVREWSRMCEEAADKDYAARGETPPT